MQGSILLLTSNPTRTSPVKRGKWVLENLLAEPPPPPPPNVPELGAAGVALGTLRQQMEQHRADPNCAVCHVKMDAVGFAEEGIVFSNAHRDFLKARADEAAEQAENDAEWALNQQAVAALWAERSDRKVTG